MIIISAIITQDIGKHLKMYRVYQHWDPLKVCAVGRSYPPEYYSWIKNAKIRNLFEKIAIETEEDYQCIIKLLQSFGVEIVRPNLPIVDPDKSQTLTPPPMNPRDSMIMIGETFYNTLKDWNVFYKSVKDSSWPMVDNINDLEHWQKQECEDAGWYELGRLNYSWQPIIDKILQQGNTVKICNEHSYVNGASVSRIGKDLYFSIAGDDLNNLDFVCEEFAAYRPHIIKTLGHGDCTYCPVAPGLIISLRDISTYAETFPDWEVVYLPYQSWDKVQPFLDLKEKNQGRWWIPGWEYDADLVNVVETWISHWVGYVEETVFDVNMLAIDLKNVVVFNHNDQVFAALDRHGITPHVIPFRHRYFWDGGIHCITLDLDRDGKMHDFFPKRRNDF